MTLHTSASIQLASSSGPVRRDSNDATVDGSYNNPFSPLFAGQITTSNCAIDAPNQDENAGCAILDPSPLTYGTDFNANGGGVFAVQRTSSAINMWFFPRGKFPSDIVNSQPNPNPSWGRPRAVFQGDFSIDEHFAAQQIVFDTTFCGGWAGKVWASNSQCSKLASTCEEYVTNNPEAFREAYWAVNTLQVFQDDGPEVQEVKEMVKGHKRARKRHGL
jgi:hypothetical protein